LNILNINLNSRISFSRIATNWYE